MAKIRVYACDTQHGDIRPAAGRIGIQEGDAKVRWHDACHDCIEQARELLASLSGERFTKHAHEHRNGDGSLLTRKGRRTFVMGSVRGSSATRTTPAKYQRMTNAEREEAAAKCATIMRKAGPMNGTELMAALQLSKGNVYRLLRDLGAKKTGERAQTLWSLNGKHHAKAKKLTAMFAKSAKAKAERTKGKGKRGKRAGFRGSAKAAAETPAPGAGD